MQLITTKQHFEAISIILQNYFPLLKKTLLKDCKRYSKLSTDYLGARVFVSVIDELLIVIQKRALKNSINFTLKLSECQGIFFFQTLISMPVNSADVYTNNVRNNYIDQLNKQIIKNLDDEN